MYACVDGQKACITFNSDIRTINHAEALPGQREGEQPSVLYQT